MTDTNLTNHNEMKTLIQGQLDRAYKAMMDLANAYLSHDVEAWESKGGCKKCEGNGRVLTWSTLDGSGYDEFGPCQECTDASREVGRKPAVWSARGSAGGHSQSTLDYAKEHYSLGMASVVETYEIAKSNHFQCIEQAIQRQDYIIVVKGRKVPVGSHGMVVAVVGGDYGPRVGMIDGNGTVVWVAQSNVERCLGMDGSTKNGAIEAYIKNDNDYRRKKNLPLKNHDAVAMMMKTC